MKRLLLTVALLVSVSLPAAAQEPGKVGVVMGYPASIGIIWHASDRIAIRPDFNVTQTSSESTSAFGTGLKIDGWNLGVGVSALIYTSKTDNLRTYVSPRLSYARNTAHSDATVSISSSDNTANTYQFAGSFGAQYSLGRRFSVYGEAGLGYSRSTSTFQSSASLSGVATGKTTSQSVGIRTAVGVVLYFD